MNDVNEKKMSNASPTYKPTDDDLPKELWAAESKAPRRFIDAQFEATRQIREMGLRASNQEIDIAALVLFGHWEDEQRKQEKT